VFKRSILNKLGAWKRQSDRKPLVLRGARQVGKTTAVEMFSGEFDNYIYLNLERGEDRSIFREDMTVHEIFNAILIIKNIQLREGSTLLFIDEIQNSPVAVMMLRYFHEEKKDIHVIAAGSLLEIMLDENRISFPTGRVQFLHLYPLSFEEFLDVKGERKLLDAYYTVPVEGIIHQKLLALFHEYTLIGGMPEIVRKYLEGTTVTGLKSTYEALMISYINDTEKYARNQTMRHVLRHCLESLPYEAGNRIKFHGFGKSQYGSREVGESMRLLEKAMLIHLIYPTTNTEPPAVPDIRKSPRLQFLDTGLLNYFAGLQQHVVKAEDLHSFYRGIIAEHVVRQEFIALDMETDRKPVFWVREKKQSNSEVDVLVPFRESLIPVEIKAGKAGTLRSLHQFIDAAPHQFAVRLWSGEVRVDPLVTSDTKRFRLLSLPYYLVGMLDSYIAKYYN